MGSLTSPLLTGDTDSGPTVYHPHPEVQNGLSFVDFIAKAARFLQLF